MSTAFPGLGQFYNEFGHRKVQGKRHRSWWRAPLFWAGLTATGYLAYTNGVEANKLKTEWLSRNGPDSLKVYPEYQALEDNTLINGNSFFYGFNDRAKFRDYSIAGIVFIYGLNVLDAFVDAHFVSFDVSQNLSVSLYPKMYRPTEYGVGLQLSFK